MTKTRDYEIALTGLADWDDYLMRESGLPGPRGNLELADAFANLADERLIVRLASLGPDAAPVNTPQEFLAFCGVLGYGRLVADGKLSRLGDLRQAASDPRWRLREACARAMQRVGDADLPTLLRTVAEWSGGNRLEQRAALASICEPRLLRDRGAAELALALLDRVTASIRGADDTSTVEFRVLRQGLGYCWSVAVIALPEQGKPTLEKWLVDDDAQVRWVIRENLGKARLARMDPVWVAAWKSKTQERTDAPDAGIPISPERRAFANSSNVPAQYD